jgi:hypothetical protein
VTKPDDYLWDRSGPADPEVERLEQLLAPLAHDRPLDELRLRRPRRRRTAWIIGGVVALAAVAVLALVLRTRGPGGPCSGDAGFTFVARGGTVGCNDGQVARGVLPVGGVLDTGTATAEIAIAKIGTAELAPGTRIRLDRSDTDKRQELHLERGHMHARVTAPPRIFAVTTASTGVTDLGCEYTIEIDAHGKGWIEVQSGKVELETLAHAVIVAPAGTTARLLEGRRPSVPIATTAPAPLRAAVAAFEQGEAGALARVLVAVTADDGITLANLAVLVPADRSSQPACVAPCSDRSLVLDRLAELSPPPDGVTVRAALSDPTKLETWREAVLVDHLALHEEQNAEKRLQKK